MLECSSELHQRAAGLLFLPHRADSVVPGCRTGGFSGLCVCVMIGLCDVDFWDLLAHFMMLDIVWKRET